jgi:hypothetical protein
VYWSAGDSSHAVALTGVADANWTISDQTGVWVHPDGTYGE